MSRRAQPQRVFSRWTSNITQQRGLPSPFGDVLSDILTHRSEQYIHRSFLRWISSIVTCGWTSSIVTCQVDVQHCYMPGGCPAVLHARWTSSIVTCGLMSSIVTCQVDVQHGYMRVDVQHCYMRVDVQHCYMSGGRPALLHARWTSSIVTCHLGLPFPFCDMFE